MYKVGDKVRISGPPYALNMQHGIQSGFEVNDICPVINVDTRHPNMCEVQSKNNHRYWYLLENLSTPFETTESLLENYNIG